MADKYIDMAVKLVQNPTAEESSALDMCVGDGVDYNYSVSKLIKTTLQMLVFMSIEKKLLSTLIRKVLLCNN